MNYILYLAFSGLDYVSQAICSIRSLYYVTNKENGVKIKIVVYTDMAERFKEAFPDNQDIILEGLSEDTLQDWMGEDKFCFRLKMKVLQDFFNKYKGSAILIDLDTFFLESAERLFEKLNQTNNVLMYSLENTVEQKIADVQNFSWKYNHDSSFPFFRSLKNCNIVSGEGNTYEFQPSTQLWNSGVVGIKPSDILLLDKILKMADIIYKNFHDKFSEQIAFSYIFQYNRNLTGCDEVIFHYWFLKNTRFFLAYFFKCLNPSDEIEFLSLLKVYHLEGLYGTELEYEDIPLIVACLIRRKYSEYFSSMFQFDFPKETYFGKLLQADTDDKLVEYLSLKYKLDFGIRVEVEQLPI